MKQIINLYFASIAAGGAVFIGAMSNLGSADANVYLFDFYKYVMYLGATFVVASFMGLGDSIIRSFLSDELNLEGKRVEILSSIFWQNFFDRLLRFRIYIIIFSISEIAFIVFAGYLGSVIIPSLNEARDFVSDGMVAASPDTANAE